MVCILVILFVCVVSVGLLTTGTDTMQDQSSFIHSWNRANDAVAFAEQCTTAEAKLASEWLVNPFKL